MKWSLSKIASVLGTTAHGDADITSVTIDSRSADQGSLFVALRGENHDGHSFVGDAISSGAAKSAAESIRA